MNTQSNDITDNKQVSDLLENYLPDNYRLEIAEKLQCHPNNVGKVKKELLKPSNVFRSKLQIDIAENIIKLCQHYKSLNNRIKRTA